LTALISVDKASHILEKTEAVGTKNQ